MSEVNLHPKVEAFKHFINERPELIIEMRQSHKTLQDYYEKWYMDETFRHSEKDIPSSVNESEILTHVLTYLEHVDIYKMKHHLKRVNRFIDTIRVMLDGIENDRGEQLTAKQEKQLFDVFRD